MAEYGEWRFKIVRIKTARQGVLARLSNLMVARAAFDVCVSLWSAHGSSFGKMLASLRNTARVNRVIVPAHKCLT